MKFTINYSNTSKFDLDILWFVAQDIEHLKTLHSKTNKDFKINKMMKSDNKNNLYSYVEYTTWRKILKLIIFKVETVRKIEGDKIIYIEQHKYLKTSIKNTHFIEKNNDNYILRDYLEFDTPFIIYLFKPFIKFLVIRHLESQFAEDELFRKRLQLLKNKLGNLKEYIWLD
jgi:hypothetical protein